MVKCGKSYYETATFRMNKPWLWEQSVSVTTI